MATKDKYDRQLRLWGLNGQRALYESIIVLVNATATGTETLKNLVLPGIGSFHIVDDQLISHSLSNNSFSNFFVPSQNGGIPKSRAEVATVYLSELNSEVSGSYTAVHSLSETDFPSLLSHIYAVHSSHDMTDSNSNGFETHRRMFIIAADLPPTILLNLSSACWNYGSTLASSIPLVVVRSYGLIGTVRLQVRYHPIIESKPDNSVPDLRIINTQSMDESCLFPPLRNLVDKIHLEELDSQTHGHVPYVIILVKALDRWISLQTGSSSSTSSSRLPKTVEEKSQFRSIIQQLSRDFSKEINFQEAYENAYLGYAEPQLPSEVSSLLEHVVQSWDSSIPLHSSFDVLLLALHRFMIRSSNQPPIHGSIPDMTSSTERYIELQQIYKVKAEEDRTLFQSLVQEILYQVSQAQNVPSSLNVTDEQLSLFCKNVNNLRLVHTRSLVDEYKGVYDSVKEKEEILDTLVNATWDAYEDEKQTPLLWYILLRACDSFYHQFGKFPGSEFDGVTLESEIKYLEKAVLDIIELLNLKENELIVSTLLSKVDDETIVNRNFLQEIIRFDNAEIHAVASLVAGVASQEAVKLITGQFVPIDGTYIFNGIASVANVYKV